MEWSLLRTIIPANRDKYREFARFEGEISEQSVRKSSSLINLQTYGTVFEAEINRELKRRNRETYFPDTVFNWEIEASHMSRS